ncbi:MAG: hypothetical protein ACR2M1_09255 [Gemmatimonadaceae bacterium]
MALPSKELSESALDALIAPERTRIVAPLTEWRTLALQLREEGLLRTVGPDATAAAGRSFNPASEDELKPRSRPGWKPAVARWTMRVAAGAALVGGGVVIGRGMTMGDEIVQTVRMAIAADTTEVGPHGTINVRVGGKPFSSTQEAKRVLVKSQSDYQRAAAFLLATDTSTAARISPDLYKERLAALDEMTTTAMNALKDVPGDPLLNQYYLSAAAAREGTLQQLDKSLPPGATMVRF